MFEEPDFKKFHDYWIELRGEGPLPRKSDFDPARVSSFIADLMIIQWMPPDMLHVRLLGTGITQRTNRERTGQNLLDSIFPPQRHMIADYVTAIFAPVAVGSVSTRRCYGSGATVGVEHAYFPFQSDDGVSDIIIGVHKADVAASRLVPPGDEMQHAEIRRLEFLDVGNGIPDFSFQAKD